MMTPRMLAGAVLLLFTLLLFVATHHASHAQDFGGGGDEAEVPPDKSQFDHGWKERERTRKKAARKIRKQKAERAVEREPEEAPAEWELWEITTVLGDGKEGDLKDGIKADKVRFKYPADVVVDQHGRVIVADTNNNKIRCWDPETEALSTLFGNGQLRPRPYTGKVPTGKATEVQFEAPYDVWLDPEGKVLAGYLVGSGVATLTKEGLLDWKFVQNYGARGSNYPVDDSVHATLLVHERHRVWDIEYAPDGTMYIADHESRQVLRVDPDTHSTQVVAGNGSQGFSGDGGPAVDAGFYSVRDIAFDAAGDMYITDMLDSRIRKVSMDTGIITTFAGNGKRGYDGDGGPAVEAAFDRPCEALWHPNGKLYVLDSAAHCVRVIDPESGTVDTLAGQGYSGYEGDCQPLFESLLYSPKGMCVDSEGCLYIADTGNHCIRKLTPKASKPGPITPGPDEQR